jgi:acyl-coenzyme A synthetase/AMP-(fatty) acid ligase
MKAIVDLSPAAPCPAEFNLAAYVLAAGRATPDKMALNVYESGQPRRYSYAELTEAVLGTATGLKAAGVRAGDRVMIRIGSTANFPVCFLALAALDAIAIPISVALSQSETLALLETASPAAIIFDQALPCRGFNGLQIDVDQIRCFANYPPAGPIMGDPNRPCYIIFTSGTSGRPRAVLHAHRAVWARRMIWKGWYDLRSDDVMMHAGALNWTYTLGTGLLDPWAIGATAIIPNTQKIEDVWDIMRSEQATIFAAVPGIYRRLLATPNAANVPALRHGLSAGDTLPKAIRAAWHTHTNTPLCEAFGMTECSTFLSAPPTAHESLAVQPGRRIAILGRQGLVERGKLGFISVDRNDPGLMLGYLKGTDIKLPLRDGWFQTEDQAVMHQDGSLSFTGRSGDMMNAGGYRVAPREIEQVLEEILGVQEVGVAEVEVKPDVWVIAAFVICEFGFNESRLIHMAQQHLARYKQPRIVQRVTSLPRNANGKLIRSALPHLWNSK